MIRLLILFLLLPFTAQAAVEQKTYVANLPACQVNKTYIVRDALNPVKGETVVGLGHRWVRVACVAGAWKVRTL